MGKLADLGTRFQAIPLRQKTTQDLIERFGLKKWPEILMDHIDVLNLGEYGRGVEYKKLKALQTPNFIQLPWSFPSRKLQNFFEVLDMYNFKGIVEVPFIRNKALRKLREKGKMSVILERSKKNFRTSIRSSVHSEFIKLE